MPQTSGETWKRGLEEEETELPTSLEESEYDQIPGLTILCHPDRQRVGQQARLQNLVRGKAVALSRLQPAFSSPRQESGQPLGVRRLSRSPMSLAPDGSGGICLHCRQTSTSVIANGERILDKRTFTQEELSRGIVLLLGNRIVLLLHYLHLRGWNHLPDLGLVGESRGILRLRHEIKQVGELNVPVLLRGETGTGKELVAEAIHQASPRHQGPFLTINMGAIPSSLAAAELFGADRGAFTGAERRRDGYFNRADGGTLFLDEIGETPLEAQPLLLRALDNQEIQPVGSSAPIKVDVRILAATDLDLEQAIQEGRFRAPLLHRLGSYEIHVPPLRDRREDIGRLLYYFLDLELSATGQTALLDEPSPERRPWLPARLVAALAVYSWPGNVRQLRNIARHLVVSSRDEPQVRIGQQLRQLLHESTESTSTAVTGARASRSPKEISEQEMIQALRANRWNPGPTARQLGISRGSLYLLIDKCPNTRKASDLSREEVARSFKRCGGQLEQMVDELEVSLEGLKRRIRYFSIQ